MQSLSSFRFFLMFIVISMMIFLAWRTRRNNRNAWTKERGVDFRPSIGFTRLDGWKSLALLLDNQSGDKVWAEEIEINPQVMKLIKFIRMSARTTWCLSAWWKRFTRRPGNRNANIPAYFHPSFGIVLARNGLRFR